MVINKILTMKSDDRGVIYSCGNARVVKRKKGTISADHSHSDPETNFLIQGKIELTEGDNINIIEAPAQMNFESEVFHKILALTDIILIYFK